jgi:signal transduction histidine kinase
LARTASRASTPIRPSIAFADANEHLRQNLVALALVAILALAMAWVGGNLLYARKMSALARAAGRVATGDLSARTSLPRGVDELSQLACAFDNMAEALAKREQERTEEARARAQLLQQLISAQEDERRRIARELHDETSQGLSVLIVSLETVGMELASAGLEVSRSAQMARAVAQDLLDGIRRLIGDLRPSLLDDLGLAPAIAWYAEERLQALGIEVDLQCSLSEETRLPPVLETALFRIAQEAISNTARHAGATKVAISLRVVDSRAILSTEDNGRGFEPARDQTEAAKGKGVGLQGIRERVSLLGGQFRLRTAPGQGTTIEVEVPLVMGETVDAQDASAAG